MAIRDLDDLPVEGRRVFLRADLNVPIREGSIANSKRIEAALPTCRSILDRSGRLIVASHLGRPKGKRRPELSLEPVCDFVAEAMNLDVQFADDCVGPDAERRVRDLQPGEILLLENLRFHREETANDDDFAERLASLCDVYVNDAFGAAHRAHASTTGMVPFVVDRGIGPLMRTELDHLEPLLGSPARPFVVILGGAKVSDKIGVIQNLLNRVDALLIGGAMAYTFLASRWIDVGSSRVEENQLDVARQLLARAKRRGVRVLLPIDHVTATSISEPSDVAVTGPEIPEGRMGVDIGPETIALFNDEIERASTIFWNGPLGVFEVEAFSRGSFAIAHAIGRAKGSAVVGGGDSVSAVVRSGYANQIGHLSTGGGAALEFLEGRELPALAALEEEDAS